MKHFLQKAFFLKKIPLFHELELELLLAIAEKLHEDQYDAGEKVFSKSQVANRIYLIEKGSVDIFLEKEKMATLQETDLFGDEALCSDQPRHYEAICAEDSLLLSLSKSHFFSILSECPSTALLLLRSYAQSTPFRTSRSILP